MSTAEKNPLLDHFDTIPFQAIQPEHFLPAIEKLIAQAKNEIDDLVANPEEPTFENTLEALEFTGLHLNRVSGLFFNLNAAETDETIQAIARKLSPLLTEFANDIRLNKALFRKIEQVYKTADRTKLTTEQITLLDTHYRAYIRNGANLEGPEKEKLRTIDKKLADLKLAFGEHVLADTQAFELHLTEEKDLEGLPESIREQAASLAEGKDKEGWLFTLDYPSYVPFMTYASNRELRKSMALAFSSRGFKDNENNNEDIVTELVQLRQERAALLGYESHAHFVLEERMAEHPDTVMDFLDDLREKAMPVAKEELLGLQKLAANDGIDILQSWDTAYYKEKLKMQRFDLDQEKLRPYFELDKVLQGLFEVAERLFSFRFEETDALEVYHEEVRTFNAYDEKGNFKALLYADFFPRPGKRNGAWMTSYRGQWKQGDASVRPQVSIVCNFTRPTASRPSLLTFNELTTLFHEFGHALHGMLADTTYPSLSGTHVFWDFVELPSQLMENWCYEQEALHLFASHFETGDLLPMELVNKIKEASNFMEGMQTLRQLSFGYLDMAWHKNPGVIEDVRSHEIKVLSRTRLLPEVEGVCMSTAFSHIFQGGYSSGYYSYKWAEVLDADVFESFQEAGIFDRNTAKRLVNDILSKGGTVAPMDLFIKFKGRKPNPEALLKRAGLLRP
jgi:peptidyl-dipeptidase Dcp